MRSLVGALVALLLVAVFPPLAGAQGVVNSPLPSVPVGGKAKHLFTIPGVIKHAELSTVVTCTSTEKKKPMSLVVQFYDFDGTGAGGGGDTVLPGQSKAYSIGTTAYAGTTVFAADDTAPRMARVAGTSSKVICAAMVVDATPDDDHPASGWALPVIKKTAQKGE